MDNNSLRAILGDVATPQLADACVRLQLPLRLAPPGIRPVVPGARAVGRALPVRHFGSVDVFFEALEVAEPGDLLVIDNGGRMDEGCIGDLTVLEAQAAGLGGMLVWGCHRDTAELISLGFPVFSYGVCPAGPRRLDPRDEDALALARFGSSQISRSDVAFADLDGVLFVELQHAERLLEAAKRIRDRERQQAEAIAAGTTLREQLRFGEYLARRSADGSYSFRKHLRSIGGAIEEESRGHDDG